MKNSGVSAGQIFRELDEGKWKPFYLVVGEEPFQAGEIQERVRAFFASADSPVESFEGDSLDGPALLASLQELPGLFADEGKPKLIFCSRIDKASASAMEALESYFQDPNPTTCLLMTAAKADRRKGWVKAVDSKGYLVEVAEPYDRDWPRWQGYFAKKLGKRIAAEAWDLLVESSGRSLSVLWAEAQKAALYIGNRPEITKEDMAQLASFGGDTDVFAFAEEVLCRRSASSLYKFHRLVQSGENEVKLMAILLRQFRLVDHCLRLNRQGITDSKSLASQLGTHPFFVPQILGQMKHQSPESLDRAFHLLAEADYRLKTGGGHLFESFLVPYFS